MSIHDVVACSRKNQNHTEINSTRVVNWSGREATTAEAEWIRDRAADGNSFFGLDRFVQQAGSIEGWLSGSEILEEVSLIDSWLEERNAVELCEEDIFNQLADGSGGDFDSIFLGRVGKVDFSDSPESAAMVETSHKVGVVSKWDLVPAFGSYDPGFDPFAVEGEGVAEPDMDFSDPRGSFNFIRELGAGTQGRVSLVTDRVGKEYALKQIPLAIALKAKTYAISNERGEGLALSFPKHQNLMRTYGIITYNRETGQERYVTDRSHCTECEVVVGILNECVPNTEELYDYRVRNDLNAEEVKSIGLQLGSGLSAIHQAGFLHRDIKLENALVDSDGNVKLIDFGFSRYLPEDARAKTICGSPHYIAPELIRAEEYGHKIDAWFLGVTFFVLAFNGFPFDGSHAPTVMNKIVAFESSDEKMSDLVDGRSEELKNWPLVDFLEFRALLDKLICPQSRRISVQEALNHPFFIA